MYVHACQVPHHARWITKTSHTKFNFTYALCIARFPNWISYHIQSRRSYMAKPQDSSTIRYSLDRVSYPALHLHPHYENPRRRFWILSKAVDQWHARFRLSVLQVRKIDFGEVSNLVESERRSAQILSGRLWSWSLGDEVDLFIKHNSCDTFAQLRRCVEFFKFLDNHPYCVRCCTDSILMSACLLRQNRRVAVACAVVLEAGSPQVAEAATTAGI